MLAHRSATISRCALAVTAFVAALVVGSPSSSANARRAKIVGGNVASLAQWPSVARVLINNPNGINVCSGTVVAPNVVLTAGHCASAAWRFEVVTHTTSAKSGGETSAVSDVVQDPQFKVIAPNGVDLTDYDAALLKLTTPTTVPPVTLASPANSKLYAAGTRVSAAGWGWPTYVSDTVSQTLQTTGTTMAVESVQACRTSSEQAFDGIPLNTADQVCALAPSGSTGICEGDSGGPLMATAAGNRKVEIGITIWYSYNCSTRAPDYFTNVAAISGWLIPEICALSDQSASGARLACAGAYHGETRQKRPVAITVARSQTQVSGASVTVQMHCTRLHHTLAYTTHAIGSRYWPRSIATTQGLRFKDSFRDASGWRVALNATFTARGFASGTVAVTGSTRQDGSCHSGVVRWTAKRA